MSEADLVRKLLANDGDLRALARRLVVDPNDADDLAQDAWLVAVSKRLDLGGPVLGWLARVAGNVGRHLRRSAVRRDRREHAAARPEATTSAADAVERVELRRRLIDAVLALEEPLRTTVILRFFEDEPPRRIAARFGVPVETVRSRTKRALALLREKLDSGHDGRRSSWLVPLASIAGVKVPAAAAAVAASVVSPATIAAGAMVMKAKWGLVCAAVLLLAGTAWFLRPQWADPPDLGGGAGVALPGAAVASAGEIGAGAASSRSSADSRPAIAPRPFAEEPESAPSKFGTAVVTAVWKTDGKPIPNVRIRASVWQHSPAYLRTDSEGIARFDRVPVGKALFTTILNGSTRADMTPDAVVEATVEVNEGASITGTVLGPKGEGVEGAEIWLSEQFGIVDGDVVTRSGPGGTFRLRGVQFDTTRWIGARAAGYGASDLIPTFWRSSEIVMQLALKAGPGTLRGRVIGSDGNAVAKAHVHVGPADLSRELPFTDRTPKSPTFETSTDSDGVFEVAAVPAGEQTIIVQAGKHAPWVGSEIVRRGETTDIRVNLAAGAIIAGEVVNDAGKPVAGIPVSKKPYDWLTRPGWTDANGRFRLDGLAAGPTEIEAEGADSLGTCAAKVDLVPGETTTVRLTFEPGLVISGRIVDERGAPIVDCRVHLDAMGEGQDDYRQIPKVAAGAFRFARCTALEYHLTIKEPGSSYPSAELKRVRPGGEPLVIRILDRDRATASITGRVLDGDGRPIEGVNFAVFTATGWSPWIEHREDGSFRAGPMPAGIYRLSVTLDASAIRQSVYEGPSITLAPGETRDVGEIRLVNRFLLRVTRDDGKSADGLVAQLSYQMGNGAATLHVKDGIARSELLPPGSYELVMNGSDVMPVRQPVEIRLGQETSLDLQLRAGKRYRIEIIEDEAVTPSQTVLIKIKQDGKQVDVVRVGRFQGAPGPHRHEVVLADGAYTIEATGNDTLQDVTHRTVSASFTVPPPSGSSDPLVFTLK